MTIFYEHRFTVIYVFVLIAYCSRIVAKVGSIAEVGSIADLTGSVPLYSLFRFLVTVAIYTYGKIKAYDFLV